MKHGLIVLVVWICTLVLVGEWQHGAGKRDERLIWKDKETAELQSLRLQVAQARTKELNQATDFSSISAEYQKRLKESADENTTLRNQLRSGAVRLHWPARQIAAAGGGVRAPNAGAGRCDGAAASDISPEVSGFLWDLVVEADAIAEQLSACQQVLQRERMPLGADQ